MNYAIEMGSGAMIHIPSFTNIGSGIQNVIGRIQSHREEGDRISLLYESKLKRTGDVVLFTKLDCGQSPKIH
jgi:hypothetical protein